MNKKNLAIFSGEPSLLEKFKRPSPLSKSDIIAAERVLKSGLLSKAGLGPEVNNFEKNFAKFHNCKFALSVSSGTTALHTAVRALEIGPGDEVLVSALTFISTASVVLQEGAQVIFVDINEKDFCIDTDDLIKKITKRTKAIIVVHLYGLPVNMGKILKIAKKYSLKIIEDCAQAHGAIYNKGMVGTFGDLGCFSFYQTKNMTCGEGGMIITDNKKLYETCSILADHGRKSVKTRKYDYDRIGFNYHMTELQAVIANSQLSRLKELNNERLKNANLYLTSLKGTPLIFQQRRSNSSHVYYVLTALLPTNWKKERNWFLRAMSKENCDLNQIYPIPLNKTSLFKESGQKCPKAEDVCDRLINFYVNPGISEETIKTICKATKKVLNFLQNKYAK